MAKTTRIVDATITKTAKPFLQPAQELLTLLVLELLERKIPQLNLGQQMAMPVCIHEILKVKEEIVIPETKQGVRHTRHCHLANEIKPKVEKRRVKATFLIIPATNCMKYCYVFCL